MIDYLAKFRLDGKTAAVCGGLGLLGKQISIALAQSGARVIVLDTASRRWTAFQKELSQSELKIDFAHFDVTETGQLKKNIGSLFKKFGSLHVWVNTAYPRTKDWANKLEDIKPVSWQKNVDMHMNSYCIAAKEVADLMKSHRTEGSIINLGSTYGLVGPDFSIYKGTGISNPAAYSAIKGGITNFTRYVASYYGDSGIRANTISPGGVYNGHPKDFVRNYSKRTPLGRMGEAEEIASAVLFLASEASSYMTGANLVVDGGWTSI